MRTIAVSNQKGGVGKTTITVNLGAALAEAGQRVLLIDWDPQGDLTRALGLTPLASGEPSFPLLVLRHWDGPLAQLVVHRGADLGGVLDVIPASEDATRMEAHLYAAPGREHALRRALAPLADTYDVCLIDCPPGLGVIGDNGLVAAGQVLIPALAEDSSIAALGMLAHQMAELRDAVGVEVTALGIVINSYDSRQGVVVTTSRAALEAGEVPVLAVIGNRAAIREGWRLGQAVVEHAPDSQAADWYRALAAAVVPGLPATGRHRAYPAYPDPVPEVDPAAGEVPTPGVPGPVPERVPDASERS